MLCGSRDCSTGRGIVCCVLWGTMWVSLKVVLSFLASPSYKKKNVFHLQVPKKRELLKWWAGEEFNFTVLIPLPTLHLPSVITRWILLRRGGQNSFCLWLGTRMINCNSRSSFLLPSSVFQFLLSTLALFYPLTPSQLSIIRQLHNYIKNFEAYVLKGLLRVYSSQSSLRVHLLLAKHIFPLDQKSTNDLSHQEHAHIYSTHTSA